MHSVRKSILRRNSTGLFLALELCASLVAGCNSGSAGVKVDFLEFMNPNIQIVLERMPGQMPDSAEAPYYTWREDPFAAYLPPRSRVVLEVHSASLSFEAEARADSAAGEAEVILCLGAGNPDVYADPNAFSLSQRKKLPAHFTLTSTDSRLNAIFSHNTVYAGLKVRFFRPSGGASAVSMTVQRFLVDLSGYQNQY